MRNTKTEYVSCPSCGRTLFDLQEVTEQIRLRTGHLPGVSVAIMGCAVEQRAPVGLGFASLLSSPAAQHRLLPLLDTGCTCEA